MTTGAVRRAILPATVFIVVALFHYLWLGLFPEQDPAQSQWVAVDAGRSWLQSYLESQSYWLGFSYALSFSFATVALRRYREQRSCGVRNLAIGGVTFSGFLAVASCYLIGCCGSPMLVVYLNLFGAAFVPLAKPLVAALTTATIAGAWWWMNRRSQPQTSTATGGLAVFGQMRGSMTPVMLGGDMSNTKQKMQHLMGGTSSEEPDPTKGEE